MGDFPIGLIIVVGLMILSVLGKILSRKSGSEEDAPAGRPGGSPGGGGEPLSPEEALERMFREMQQRRKQTQQGAPAAHQEQVRRPLQESRPRSLDDYFEKMEEKPQAAQPVVPVARPVPMAKPVPAVRPAAQARRYSEPVVRAGAAVRRPVAPRVVLRKPKAAFATAEGPTIADEQRAMMAASKARMEAASALAGPGAAQAARVAAGPKAMVNLGGMHFDRAEAARAIVYLELLGAPRAVRPYSGPPAAG